MSTLAAANPTTTTSTTSSDLNSRPMGASGYRPHCPQIMWANPIATAPDPFQLAMERLKADSRNLKSEYGEVFEGKKKERRTTIRWADPIATVADPMAGFGRRFGDDCGGVEGDDVVVAEKNVRGRSVAWANPIATVKEPAEEEGVRRRVVVFGCEKVVLSRKKTISGRVEMDDMTYEDFDEGGCSPCSSTRLVGRVSIIGEDGGKTATPIVTVREVRVGGRGWFKGLIRNCKNEVAWLCAFNEKPLTEEQMPLLRREDGMKRTSSKPAPCYAYSMACGFCVLVFGVMAWVFCS
ncbi:hypothetical protein M409DRAFT_55421 [Zasmidium cellare ATCC 36951]|uniref:Uncharacterized protein n=1 Tax=Zasmidium cellare ATCC 36951 TaxID=1080233 RepID=A0A6A6CIR4_ZASCE|nr:uncharacterized protein M409DRAFT_55421 [Zasmidium cellare ATCC 36951]KAF2166078.1 hypothetical protein M409DRAFT_55421 [Zasmidium cellare ATCC 36951]